MLCIVTSFHCNHCMQFQGKPINQTWENGQKISFRPYPGPFRPNLGPENFFVNFFFKNLVRSVTRYNDQLSSWTIPEKTNDPILRKLSDGLADRRTDRQTDESDSIGRCPTKVERPIKTYLKQVLNECWKIQKRGVKNEQKLIWKVLNQRCTIQKQYKNKDFALGLIYCEVHDMTNKNKEIPSKWANS